MAAINSVLAPQTRDVTAGRARRARQLFHRRLETVRYST
jgi:hypothetical protein